MPDTPGNPQGVSAHWLKQPTLIRCTPEEADGFFFIRDPLSSNSSSPAPRVVITASWMGPLIGGIGGDGQQMGALMAQ